MPAVFKMEDYVDVAERIRLFYIDYPEGRLTRLGEPTVMTMGDKLFVVYTAQAYRTPDDPVPAVGTAWEPFPGPTQFTRDSELMNAETAAWGRAIVAVGIGTKKIASREEVQARQGPPPLVDERAKALKAEIRGVYKSMRELDAMALPPGAYNAKLERAEHEHERLEELLAALRSQLEHVQAKPKAEPKAGAA